MMHTYGFNRGGVFYSSPWWNSSLASNGSNFNCLSVYGDYARAIQLDEMMGSLSGGYIGSPNNANQAAGQPDGSGLLCGGDVGGMFPSPIYLTQMPNIVDVHMYPQAGDYVSDVGSNPPQPPSVQTEALIDFIDLNHALALLSSYGLFSNYPGLQSPVLVLGEITSNTTVTTTQNYNGNPLIVTSTCEVYAPQSASQIVAAYNDPSNALKGQNVVFRPWTELQDFAGACFTYPSNQQINSQGAGPYTPTKQ
jgi:hypothetical protein